MAKTDPAWLGQPPTEPLIAAFARRGIDCRGEYGEYHTLVTAGPLFRQPLVVHSAPAMPAGAESPRFLQLDVRLDAPTVRAP